MSTSKITLREDCGNSPKNEFVQKLTVAFAAGDADSVAERVSDDVRWNIVGIGPIVGKAAVTAVFGNPNREPLAELFVDKVVTHGKADCERRIGPGDRQPVDQPVPAQRVSVCIKRTGGIKLNFRLRFGVCDDHDMFRGAAEPATGVRLQRRHGRLIGG